MKRLVELLCVGIIVAGTAAIHRTFERMRIAREAADITAPRDFAPVYFWNNSRDYYMLEFKVVGPVMLDSDANGRMVLRHKEAK